MSVTITSTTGSSCSYGGYWDPTNLQCRCHAGWKGDNCATQCKSGESYGIDCINICTCGINATCDVFTGQCECETNSSSCVRCKQGLYGPTCSIPCICESGACDSSTGYCISGGSSTTLGATAIAAITLGVILSIILILILILVWALWRRIPFLKGGLSVQLSDRENKATDPEDTLNDFDIAYELGSGRNSIDTDVGSITTSNKMYPSRVVQQRELPGIPEEDEEGAVFLDLGNNGEENSMDRVDNWRFEKPPNRTDSVSSSVKAVHGSVRAKVNIHDESESMKTSMNSLSESAKALNIDVDSTRMVTYRADSQSERELRSDDYMELRRSIENLTAVIANMPLAVSQDRGSSGNVSQVGKTESSSDYDGEHTFRNVPSIKVRDEDEEMHTSGPDEVERIKRKKKRKSLHNYLAINTGNAPSSSDDDEEQAEPAEVFDDCILTAFNMDSGNESDSRGYNKVDRTKRSYSREIVDANEYGSLQLVEASQSASSSPSLQNKVHLAHSNPEDSAVAFGSTENHLETNSDNINERPLVDSEQISLDDQYLEVKINGNDVSVNVESDSQYLETIPIVNQTSDSLNKLREIEKQSENSFTQFSKQHAYENKLGLIMGQAGGETKSSETPDAAPNPLLKTSMSHTASEGESKIRQLSQPFMSDPTGNSRIQPIALPMKSKIPLRINKQFTI